MVPTLILQNQMKFEAAADVGQNMKVNFILKSEEKLESSASTDRSGKISKPVCGLKTAGDRFIKGCWDK